MIGLSVVRTAKFQPNASWEAGLVCAERGTLASRSDNSVTQGRNEFDAISRRRMTAEMVFPTLGVGGCIPFSLLEAQRDNDDDAVAVNRMRIAP